ncbi:bifunctional diaminohydroxyphosphoribosylaminopyrimidine deaminase/5-amino-6-(5-phosphoribosylamino)uracil reductase RibD [Terrimonas alba]|uniref:bifunctional diaminohydroxyphosphoribosylaminopyrimidine deaminase/5-amino-6-(5-phosphoribosylamino)uracil reductase RibD n=1 Tax=Terrimonas alba TaxID=3349636 RepID=UPI0035F4BAE1
MQANLDVLTAHEIYMTRCLQLAKLGAGYVAPNPMVGAVLIYEDKVIGEGWHQRYGEAHAEVNCIHQAIEYGYEDLVPKSTLYVSLEPCAHFGKTPPCADLIIKHRIPKVIIGCRDPFKEVNGKGIEKLIAAGIQVETGILEKQSKELNKRFFTFHQQQRPYIILKWAQTAAGKISSGTDKRLLISNDYSNRLVHKWRSEEAAIMVGTNTALLDNPSLTNRLFTGPSPLRLVLDINLRLPSSLNIFKGNPRTIIFNSIKQEETGSVLYCRLNGEGSVVSQMMQALYQMKIQSVLVEGGASLLQCFIREKLFDEARIIQSTTQAVEHDDKGLQAPCLSNATLKKTLSLQEDTINIFKRIQIDS